MAIPYDKKMKEIARDEDKYLIQISIDGKYLSDETATQYQNKLMGHARFQHTGPATYEEAKALWGWYKKYKLKKE